MSIEQTPADEDFNLDDFSADFFGQNQTDQEETKPDEAAEEVDEDAPIPDDTHPEDDDTLDTETDEPEVKPKKNRFQERIDEVVGKQREAERRAQALESQLQEAIERLNQQSQPVPAKVEAKNDAAPSPTDTNEDGTEKYPLGEFDAKFLQDFSVYHAVKRVEAELAQRDSATKEAQERARVEQENRERQKAWDEKLEPARERYPDYNEKVTELVESLSDIDSSLGSYLTTQIMDMEHGTEVLYYLATHPEEARSIVDSGTNKAAIRLGALEERVRPKSEKPSFKTSSAPNPPPTNRGATGAHVPLRGDEEDIDLDAFSKELFKKRR